jgi:hypothetical protein
MLATVSRSRFVAALVSLISLGCDDPPASQDADENGESESESSSESSTGEDEGTTQSLDGESTDGESSDGESSEEESNEEESSEGETGDAAECPSSTDIEGTPAPLPSPPDCEFVCPQGWSNPTLPLEVAWTLDLDPVELESRGVALLPGTGGSVLVIADRNTNLPMRMHSISSAGELEWTVEVDEVDHLIQSATSDSTGTIYVDITGYNPLSWAPEGHVVAISPTGEFQWMTGPQSGIVATMAPRSEGVVAIIQPASIPTPIRYLISVSSEGVVEWSTQTLDVAMSVAVAPNGDVVVTNKTEYAIYTSLGVQTEIHPQAFEAEWLGRARFVDGETLVQSGMLLDDEFGADGLIAWQQLGGSGSYERYRMGDLLCNGELSRGQTSFTDFVALLDGSLAVVGNQGFLGVADAQPWVGHVDAGGDLIAVDLGVWKGYADDVIAVDDGSVLVLINHHSQDTAFQVRKYLLD